VLSLAAATWDVVAAIGTATGAVFSAGALIFAARAAQAASQAAKAADDQLLAQTMPVVVDVRTRRRSAEDELVRFFDGTEISAREDEVILTAPDEGYEKARISVPVENVGTGLAVITSARLKLDREVTDLNLIPVGSFTYEPGAEGQPGSLVASPVYLPAGGRLRLATEVLRHPGIWDMICAASLGKIEIGVQIDVTDAADRRGYRTSLRIFEEDDAWYAFLDETQRVR
jgi:hypothetical protein